ncbi:MAG: RnfABCDGE type electron transport complex subunit D, partial [Alistipes sp.]|nr:RnfABCDGE type electron transport complex subunit D [Alistipes sp.]
MANKLIVAPAPHVQTSHSTARIMRDVVIALVPALIVSTVVFGWSVLCVTALSVLSCVGFEYLIQRFLVGGKPTVGNWSAVVTGVLLAFNLPASIPWWIVVMGAFVAIAIAKMTFGGLGKNPFNPALVGRVFRLIADPG